MVTSNEIRAHDGSTIRLIGSFCVPNLQTYKMKGMNVFHLLSEDAARDRNRVLLSGEIRIRSRIDHVTSTKYRCVPILF